MPKPFRMLHQKKCGCFWGQAGKEHNLTTPFLYTPERINSDNLKPQRFEQIGPWQVLLLSMFLDVIAHMSWLCWHLEEKGTSPVVMSNPCAQTMVSKYHFSKTPWINWRSSWLLFQDRKWMWWVWKSYPSREQGSFQRLLKSYHVNPWTNSRFPLAKDEAI